MDTKGTSPIYRNKSLDSKLPGEYFPKWGSTSILSPYNAKKLEKTNEHILRYFGKGPFSSNFVPFYSKIPKFGPKRIFPERLGSVIFLRLWSPNFKQETKN